MTETTRFVLTFESAKNFPGHLNPTFPQQCVKCGASPNVIERRGYKLVRFKDQKYTSFAIEKTYNAINATFKIPWCSAHKEESDKQESVFIQSLGISFGLIMVFASIYRLIEKTIKPYEEGLATLFNRFWTFTGLDKYDGIVAFLEIAFAILIFMVIWYILYRITSRFMSKRKGLRTKTTAFSLHAFTIGRSQSVADKITLHFSNLQYANLFAQLNNWQATKGY